jgi:hypothetical protein
MTRGPFAGVLQCSNRRKIIMRFLFHGCGSNLFLLFRLFAGKTRRTKAFAKNCSRIGMVLRAHVPQVEPAPVESSPSVCLFEKLKSNVLTWRDGIRWRERAAKADYSDQNSRPEYFICSKRPLSLPARFPSRHSWEHLPTTARCENRLS